MDAVKLNPHHANILAKFRIAVQDCELKDSSDVYLLRWLVAREFDIPKAEKMLRNSLEWRRHYNIDTLLEDYESPEVFKKYFSADFVGYDKFNNPVWVARFGRIDLKGLLLSAKKKDFLYHVFSLVETSIKKSKEYQEKYNSSPSVITQSTIIFDVEHLSMRQITYKPAVDSALQAVQFYEANYPELLRRVFVINAPKIFNVAIALVKPFLNETTANKVKILAGNNASHWRNAILKEIDADQFPAYYGGTMTDPDGNPNCISKINMGGLIPKSYYFNDQSNKKSNYNNKKILTISYGSKEKLEYNVKLPGSKIRWNFYSEEGDISFGIYKKNGNQKTVIVPKDRVDCHIAAEEGEISVEPSEYVIEFDNSFSYLRSKIIWYSIDVDVASKIRMDLQ